MAKSTGLFKRRTEDRGVSEKDTEGLSSRASKNKSKEKGTLSDAFEDIEAEEKKVESPKRLFRETNRLEDELIQYLAEKPLADNGVAPPETEDAAERTIKVKIRSEPVRNEAAQIPLKINKLPESRGTEPSHAAVPAADRPESSVRSEPRPDAPQPYSLKPETPFPEDSIYELIKAQEAAEYTPPPVRRLLRQPERTKHVHQRVLKIPPPKPEPVRRIVVGPPAAEETIQVPIKAIAEAEAERKFTAGAPILTEIRHEYLTLTLLMRWIEFLLERVTRDKLSLVLDYYVDIGWIGEKARSEAMTYARGEMQDVNKYMSQEDEISDESPELKVTPAATYKKVDDWRLSADDHLKSLLFITKMAGIEVDRDKLNSLEQSIKRFKENLEGYYAV